MRKLLNTLYVNTQGAYLHRDGETVAVKIENEVRLRVPVHTLEGLVCFGQVSCSPPLLGMCAEHDVGVSFMSEQGRFLARVQGPVSGNVLLRRQQYRIADNKEAALPIVIATVAGKIANSRTVLLRGAREAKEKSCEIALRAAAELMSRTGERVCRSVSIDQARGCEGEAAQIYFGVFPQLIGGEPGAFEFHGRSRRPPLDNVNALLSFVYAMLAHDVRSALETVGLDPAVGFLHTDRPGRPSLALDLMEEFRPQLADRLVLTLINRRQVSTSGFEKEPAGGVRMTDATRKEVITAWQRRKQEEIEHPFLNEKIPLGLVPHAQALLLARYIRGGLDGYPPFLWRG